MDLGSKPSSYFAIDDYAKYKYVEKYGQSKEQEIWFTYDVQGSSRTATALRIPPSNETDLSITDEITKRMSEFEANVKSVDVRETYVSIVI